ncbi:microsomal glutathione S-transferase 2-like [Lampetra fluviatilis]
MIARMEDVALLLATSLLSCWQNAYFLQMVVKMRRKYNIKHPFVTGNTELEIVYRANQNLQDYYPIFLVTMWTAGLFTSSAAAAFIGLMYIVARYKYFKGYMGTDNKRVPGYFLAKRLMFSLSALSAVGLLNFALWWYYQVSLLDHLNLVAKAASALLLFV